MGVFVICAYRPKPGKQPQLRAILKDHLQILRRLGLATRRPSYLMRSLEGTYVEVFEWKSAKAIERAHNNPTVHAMWAKFDEACTYEAVGNLEEAKRLFSEFTPVDI